jgi:hypothetical protein
MSNIKFIFSYYFSENNSPTNYIFEIKYIDLPDDTPKHLRFPIYLYYEEKLEKLEFKSMFEGIREFQDNSILDANKMIYTRDEKSYEIMNCTDEERQMLLDLIK